MKRCDQYIPPVSEQDASLDNVTQQKIVRKIVEKVVEPAATDLTALIVFHPEKKAQLSSASTAGS